MWQRNISDNEQRATSIGDENVSFALRKNPNLGAEGLPEHEVIVNVRLFVEPFYPEILSSIGETWLVDWPARRVAHQ